MKDAWTQVTQSEYPWEREALDYLKRRLPDHEPYRAWANFEFLLDGVVSEVDVLVAVPKGLFLVEIKSWPGRLEGDAGTWRWTRPGATGPKLLDNPYVLANRKAKRLKSLLARQRAFRSERVPFVAPLVFLSNAELDCRLGDDARHGVTGLDPTDSGASVQKGGLPGIATWLTSLTREEAQALGQRRIDRPASRRIAEGLEQAGVRPARRARTVGDLQLGELLNEGSGYQDFLARHPRFPEIEHRARVYASPDLASTQEREQALRAARREYELLHAVSHPGIVTAQGFYEHELGPVIVFERDPSEVRLDQFIDQAGPTLSLDDRLALIRQLAEAVDYAHRQRLFHRALAPQCVLVSAPDKPSSRRCRIISWQTGARAGTSSFGSVAGTEHLGDLVDEAAAAYLAPEGLTQPDADAQLLDVFSLGALAYLIFSGQPPAQNRADLVQKLTRGGSLEISAALDGAGGALDELVRDATQADAAERLASVGDLLALLDLVEEEATAPTSEPEPRVAPPAAGKDDELGGFTVERRLGRGSTAVALLVHGDDGAQRVLKVAADPERNPRLLAEGEVLAKLRDRTIIALHGEPVEIDGHVALVLSYASGGTLAERIRHDGRLPLETLQRWGEDLLAAVTYLEAVGIPHRDIKPDNLGVIELGKSRMRHLVLFDFSLARAPADQLVVGTRTYLDPFLGTGERRRWDLAADRWSTAVVLHEMATGHVPSWGADPRFAAGELTVDGDAMPRDLAGPLVAFFERAFQRETGRRFDTGEEMLRAWRGIFVTAVPTEHEETAAQEGRTLALDAAKLETPVAALGLGARALDTLERMGVLTVSDLLETQPFLINRARGIGVDTRRELVGVRRELQRRLGRPAKGGAGSAGVPAGTADAESTPDVQRVDQLVGQLVPRETARNASQVAALRALLGLEPDAGPPGRWPTQTEVATLLEVTRARIGQINSQGRQRWRRLPAVTRLREELSATLERLGGIAGAAELEAEVAADRGAEVEVRLAPLARAAVRAAVEVELELEAPRFRTRRTGERVLLASAGESLEQRQAVLDYAVRLGTAADALAEREPLAGSGEVSASLAAIKAPEAVGGLGVERLVRVAAYASSRAAVSGQLELYPRGMPSDRALRLARGALHGAEALSADELRARVAARFPEAEPLPERPALDELLERVGVELRWDAERSRYVAPPRRSLTDLTSHASPLQRFATAGVTQLPEREEPEQVIARDFEARLERSLSAGGLLYLCTTTRWLDVAARELRRFDVTPVDLDALLLRELHASAQALNVSWELVLRADAARRGEADWERLTALVERALPAVEAEFLTLEGTVLVEHPGLLVRYRQVGLLERLRERILQGGPLRGAWVLVPADGRGSRPILDGVALPVLTPNESAEIPASWLANLHRAGRTFGEAA
jgi:serine/threonine protein kinase